MSKRKTYIICAYRTVDSVQNGEVLRRHVGDEKLLAELHAAELAYYWAIVTLTDSAGHEKTYANGTAFTRTPNVFILRDTENN